MGLLSIMHGLLRGLRGVLRTGKFLARSFHDIGGDQRFPGPGQFRLDSLQRRGRAAASAAL